MNFRRLRLVLTLALLASLTAVFQFGSGRTRAANSPANSGKETKPAQVLKVGVTEYQNVEKAYNNYERLFQRLEKISKDSDQPIRFEFAIGNYGEVLEWYNRGDIDVAVLSAMPVAKLLLQAGVDELKQIDSAYIADVNVTDKSDDSRIEITDKFAKHSKNDSVFSYRPVCLTLASDPDLGAHERRQTENHRRYQATLGQQRQDQAIQISLCSSLLSLRLHRSSLRPLAVRNQGAS
jgi:hypothetical protein